MAPIDPVIPDDPAAHREKHIAHTGDVLSIRGKFLALQRTHRGVIQRP